MTDKKPKPHEFTIGEILPWKGFEFKLVAAEGSDLLLRAMGPTRRMLKQIKQKGKK